MKPYLLSGACPLAFTIVNRAHGLMLPLTRYPHLQTCMKRVSERPCAQDALWVEGRLK